MKKIYKDKGKVILSEILVNKTKSIPGSLPWLLYGDGKISTQSLYIKIGRNFEKWFKFIVGDNDMELLPDGVIKNVIGSKSKDIDLLFKDEVKKVINYREMKSNLDLDTEKLPATYEKINKITEYLENEYEDYTINSSLLHWSVYESSVLPNKYKNKVIECNKNNVDVTYPIDLFKLLSVDISKEQYYKYFRELGEMCK